MNGDQQRGGGFINLPLKVKVSIGFGLIMVFLILNAVAFYVAQERQSAAQGWTRHTLDVLSRFDNLEIDALNQQTSLRGYLLLRDPQSLERFDDSEKDFQTVLAQLLELTTDNAAQQARLQQIKQIKADWLSQSAGPIRAKIADAATLDGISPLIMKGRVHFDALRTAIADAREAEQILLLRRTANLESTIENARLVTQGFLLLGVLVALYAVRLTQSLVTRPVIEMTGLMTRLADHDHTIDVPQLDRSDEVGAIARALQAFKLMAIETHAQNWVKTGVGEISGVLQQASTVEGFATELSAGIARLTRSVLVVFHGSNDHGELAALGGYGFAGKPLAAAQVAPGEGLVGECARRREVMQIDAIPESYTRIHSGTGSAPPRVLMLLPVLSQQRVLGVLELASFAEFTALHRRLFDELMPIISLSFENLLRALKTQQLLEETQVQSEELQSSEEALRVQQEELRATNDSLHAKTGLLEQQAARLRASEEELRLQAEELRVSNEELVEKGATLQEQKLILETLQRETQDKADALARASQYKSEFLANMSHELRTPLNSLLILSRSLADNEEGHLDKDEVESAEVIYDSGSKLLQLINDILDLSKVEAGKMELMNTQVPLADVVSGMRRNFRHVASGRGLEFDIEIEPGLPSTIISDGARIDQIANNLLGNAFKFTKTGSVRVRIARPSDNLVLPPALSREQTIAISVVDTGIGIPADKMHRMFQAFEQADSGTSRQFGGTGLGLSIARGMARLLGGDIVMDSEAGVGSTFTLLLPEQPPMSLPASETSLPDEAAPATSRVPEPSPAVRAAPPALTIVDDRELLKAGDTVILIIEDDPAFARILAELIRRKGYRVLAAGDGETGLALAKQYLPSGVLLDVMLPGMDGWAVIDRMKADPQLQHIAVHFISANDDSERGLEAGAIGFLTKPVSKTSLLQAFDRLLQHAPESTRRVLLVDDDAASRHAMRSLLDEAGVELVDAGSGEDALTLVGESRFDCIVLDLGLPGMSGYEFLERASQLAPLPPVVIHSGRELSRDESLKLRQYTDSIVIKGARSPERLLDEVSLFLHSIRPAAPPPSRELEPGLSGRTVLVVDDDMRNIFALSKTLRAKGLKVLMAQDGQKALKQLQDNEGVEIVLMDIMMPGMDGYDTMREIRRQPRYASLPIIALTAKAMRGDREKCLEAGANDYLSKPIDIDKLLSMMRVWTRPRT